MNKIDDLKTIYFHASSLDDTEKTQAYRLMFREYLGDVLFEANPGITPEPFEIPRANGGDPDKYMALNLQHRVAFIQIPGISYDEYVLYIIKPADPSKPAVLGAKRTLNNQVFYELVDISLLPLSTLMNLYGHLIKLGGLQFENKHEAMRKHQQKLAHKLREQ